MSTKLKAGNATNGAIIDADTTGILELQSGSTPTTAITVDASQNVGIGTSSPGLPLDVVSSSSSYAIRIRGRVADNIGILQFTNNAATVDSAGVLSPATNTLAFSTAGTERMRIDSSGNVGIGTSSLASKLTVVNNPSGGNFPAILIQNNGGSAYGNCLGLETTGGSDAPSLAFKAYNGGTPVYYSIANNAGALTFNSNGWSTSAGTERMRIDSSGNLLVGTTSSSSPSNSSFIFSPVQNAMNAGGGIRTHDGQSGTNWNNVFNIYWTGSPQLWIDSTNLGNIQLSSDYRIKRNIETQTTPALERVMALRPVTYQMADYKDGLFKASDDIKEGFIAHEVQEVIPSGAEGVKDDENQIQSLRVDAILAVAVKAIQELNAKVDAQALEIQALKGVA